MKRNQEKGEDGIRERDIFRKLVPSPEASSVMWSRKPGNRSSILVSHMGGRTPALVSSFTVFLGTSEGRQMSNEECENGTCTPLLKDSAITGGSVFWA